MCFSQDSVQAGGCVVSTALFVLVLLLYETLLCAKIKLQGFFFLLGGICWNHCKSLLSVCLTFKICMFLVVMPVYFLATFSG